MFKSAVPVLTTKPGEPPTWRIPARNARTRGVFFSAWYAGIAKLAGVRSASGAISARRWNQSSGVIPGGSRTPTRNLAHSVNPSLPESNPLSEGLT